MHIGFISSGTTGLGNAVRVFRDCLHCPRTPAKSKKKGGVGELQACVQLWAWQKCMPSVFLQCVQLPHWRGQAQGAVPGSGKNPGSEMQSDQPR